LTIDDGSSLDPTDAEIEAWAERERQRRQQWLSGPTPEQAAVAAIYEHERGEPPIEQAYDTSDDDFDPSRVVQRLVRTTQLAAEGALSLLLHFSLSDVRERLVHAGLDWEEELFEEPTRRR